MKKVAITIAAVLAVADGVALWVYMQHKKSQGDRPAASAPAPSAAAAPEPEPLPSNAMVRREEPSGSGGGTATPGGCLSPAECDAYCAEPSHRQECLDFIGPSAAGAAATAASQGASSPEPGEERQEDPNAGQPGPGGCRGEVECAAYCSNPQRREECQEFTREANARMAEGLRKAPASQRACLKGRLGAKKYSLLLKGRLNPDQATNSAMQACMRGGGGPKRDPNKGSVEPGPDGCTDMASCTQACMKPENCSACLAWKGLPEQFRSMLNCGE